MAPAGVEAGARVGDHDPMRDGAAVPIITMAVSDETASQDGARPARIGLTDRDGATIQDIITPSPKALETVGDRIVASAHCVDTTSPSHVAERMTSQSASPLPDPTNAMPAIADKYPNWRERLLELPRNPYKSYLYYPLKY